MGLVCWCWRARGEQAGWRRLKEAREGELSSYTSGRSPRVNAEPDVILVILTLVHHLVMSEGCHACRMRACGTTPTTFPPHSQNIVDEGHGAKAVLSTVCAPTSLPIESSGSSRDRRRVCASAGSHTTNSGCEGPTNMRSSSVLFRSPSSDRQLLSGCR